MIRLPKAALEFATTFALGTTNANVVPRSVSLRELAPLDTVRLLPRRL